jgi:hypothetical protein
MALQVTTFEPVIVEDAVFLIERVVRTAGEVTARVNDLVEPETKLATESSEAGRTLTLHLARELGVAPNTVSRYLTKPIGSAFQAGEAVARTRRGLRVITASAPIAGTLTAVDEATGTATLAPEAPTRELPALVYGQVDTVLEGRGALIRASGARLRGTFAVGGEVWGPLKVAIDRPDRELTPDSVTGEVRNAVVLGGMTIGAAAIRRLAELGAKAVVVGSVSEAEIRRAVRPGEELSASLFWQAGGGRVLQIPEGDRLPIAVFVTEGFGRRPMAAPIFEFLAAREGQVASLLVPDLTRAQDAHPELYFTSATGTGDDTIRRASPASGVVARLVDPAHLGTVVTCCSEPTIDRANGEVREVVEVEWTNGSRRFVPVANLEILKVPA